MSTKITRRNFLKLTGAGAAAAAALTGCGPMARYVERRPYYEMPEYAKLGESTYYATTCRECPAGCGLIMRTMEGRAIKAEGNPNHPVSQGKICSRGLTSVQGLYNPDRITNPIRRNTRGEDAAQTISWDDAIGVVAGALGNGGGTAFLMGLAPDHLYDLTAQITEAVGAPGPYRYGITGALEGRTTLLMAMMNRFGQPGYPYFDIANADLIFTFGGDFLGSWLTPVSYGKSYGAFRRSGKLQSRGYMVAFSPHMSITDGAADEWVAVAPGSEGLVAQAIAQLVRETRTAENGQAGGAPAADLPTVVEASGVSEERLRELADLFARATSPLAIPGGSALAHGNGMATADAVLALNANRMNQPGGMFITPGEPSISAMAQIQELVQRMNDGQVQALFIHGVNPAFDLPQAMGFEAALANVPLVISFSSFPDETALMSDYVLPDHTGLESFGYQTNLPGARVNVVSAIQPVVAPLYNTRSTADVLIAAAQQAGAGLAYNDEVAFLQQQLNGLIEQAGSFNAPDINNFWAQFLQNGGWWANAPADQEEGEGQDNGTAPNGGTQSAAAMVRPQSEDSFYLITYATQLGDGSGANRPWLQETPYPMTTVTWNSWVEIHPETAARLGIHHNDVVRVRSQAGELEAPAYLYPAMRPDTIAIPFGQGHTALGRYAEGRGVNPIALVEMNLNEAGELAYGDTLVTIETTGRKRPLARLESIEGVYGESEQRREDAGRNPPPNEAAPGN